MGPCNLIFFFLDTPFNSQNVHEGIAPYSHNLCHMPCPKQEKTQIIILETLGQ
jgi:hypothetical protein